MKIGEDEDKKSFIGSLIGIFTKCKGKCSNQNYKEKNNKRKHKISIKTMARTKATVRRINAPSFVAAPGQKIGNKNILNRKMQDLKLKKVCPNKNRLRERKMAKW